MEIPRLLFVEYDSLSKRFYSLLFEGHFQTEFCEFSKCFYENIERSVFDVIVIDISVRGEDEGLKMISTIRSSDKLKNIPVVCLTAHPIESNIYRSYEISADILLHKPVENENLINTIKKLVGS